MKKILAGMMAVVLMMSCCILTAAAPNDFVASIELKPGPGLVEQETQDGRPGYAIIVMPDGTEIPVPNGGIIITPLVDADDAEDAIREALEDAFEQLQSIGSLDELVDNLQEILDSIANGTDVDDLVITDIFHIFVTDEYREYLEQGGKLHVKLDVDSDVIAALKNIGDEWSALFGDNLIDNGDGTYTLIIDQSCVIAFARDAGQVDVDYNDPEQSSPQTGDFTVVMMIGAAALLGCAAVWFVAAKKQKN